MITVRVHSVNNYHYYLRKLAGMRAIILLSQDAFRIGESMMTMGMHSVNNYYGYSAGIRQHACNHPTVIECGLDK